MFHVFGEGHTHGNGSKLVLQLDLFSGRIELKSDVCWYGNLNLLACVAFFLEDGIHGSGHCTHHNVVDGDAELFGKALKFDKIDRVGGADVQVAAEASISSLTLRNYIIVVCRKDTSSENFENVEWRGQSDEEGLIPLSIIPFNEVIAAVLLAQGQYQAHDRDSITETMMSLEDKN